MSDRPEKHLKANVLSFDRDEDGVREAITFEDGSAWVRHVGGGWECIWQPEAKAAEAIADSDPVMTYEEVLSSANRNIRRVAELEAKLVAIKAQQRVTLKAEELRLGDVIEFPTSGGKITSISSNGEITTSGNEMGYYAGKFVSWALARGAEVYRDGKLISGWPVGNPPVMVAWSGEDLLASQLKAWEDAANIRSSVKISSPDDLGKRIAELEAHLKAWQEAASVDLVGSPDEPPTPCQTPEQLIERLRHLFRWATQAEKNARECSDEVRELRKPISVIIDVITKIPPF